MAGEPRGYWDLPPEKRVVTMSPGRPEIDDRGGVYAHGVHDPRTEVTPAYAQGPSGPVEFDTATGFETQAAATQASEALNLPAGQLTAEEIAEFRALRAEKKKRDEEAAAEAAAAAARLQEPTHHVHLANGMIRPGSTIETHVDDPLHGLIAVASAHEMKPVLIA